MGDGIEITPHALYKLVSLSLEDIDTDVEDTTRDDNNRFLHSQKAPMAMMLMLYPTHLTSC